MRARGAVAVAYVVVCGAACAPRPSAPSRAAGCPGGMALVPPSDTARAFCIDRWEASLVELTPAGERPFSPYLTPEGKTVRATSQPDVVPQGYVSRDQAGRACRAASKRLCREEEWLRACRGAPPERFPYGDVHRKGACNEAGISPLRVFYPDSPDTYRAGPMNDPRLNQQPNTIARTGQFKDCAGPLGIFDMVGNLHEWVSSPRPTFRGGFYQDTHLNGEGCAYRTTAHAAEYHDYSTGFRCCADAH